MRAKEALAIVGAMLLGLVCCGLPVLVPLLLTVSGWALLGGVGLLLGILITGLWLWSNRRARKEL
jgi:hypothetical protein